MAEEPNKLPETDTKNEMAQLRREVELLRDLFFKDNFPEKQIFRKKVHFKGDATIDNSVLTSVEITEITGTSGVAPITNGLHTVSIPVGGGDIKITTVNGIITAIS